MLSHTTQGYCRGTSGERCVAPIPVQSRRFQRALTGIRASRLQQRRLRELGLKLSEFYSERYGSNRQAGSSFPACLPLHPNSQPAPALSERTFVNPLLLPQVQRGVKNLRDSANVYCFSERDVGGDCPLPPQFGTSATNRT